MAGMRQNSRNEIKICPFRDISPRKGHFFAKAAYHLTESDTPLFNSSRPAARQAFGSHFFRRGDAQQAQSVGQYGAHRVRQLQPGGEQSGLLPLDAAGVVEPVEVPG